MSDQMPPCGIYLTKNAIGPIEANRLVYFHNHGDPGPGLYLPKRWISNIAEFSERGFTLENLKETKHLEALAGEGYYAVNQSFFCCSKKCREFQPNMLVQLGYDGQATPIVFEPELVDSVLRIGDQGTIIERESIAFLKRLHIPARRTKTTARPPDMLH